MFRQLIISAAVSAALIGSPLQAADEASARGGATSSSSRQAQSQGQGTPIHVGMQEVQKLQQALNSKGFNAGDVNGRWSERSRKAAEQYQRANGLEPTGTVTIELLNSLGLGNLLTGQGGQASQGGSSSAAKAEGVPLHVSAAGVRQVQQALSQQGFNISSVDGEWGPGTQKAVRNFQRVNNMEQTGKLDTALIAALGIGQQVFSAGQQQGQQGPSGQQSQPQQQGQQQQGQQQQTPSQQGGKPQQQVQQPSQQQQPQQAQQPQQQQSQQQSPQSGQQPSQAAQGTPRWNQTGKVSKGTPLWAGPDIVRQIKQALNQKGFEVGAVDGNWGRQTTEAVRKYQQSSGLEPTGTLTLQLLGSLGLGNALSAQVTSSQGQQSQPQQQGPQPSMQPQSGQSQSPQQGQQPPPRGGQQPQQQQGQPQPQGQPRQQ